MTMHRQFWKDDFRQCQGDPDCLLRTDHGGPCYTLADRVERGFGTEECAREECGHDAGMHVASIGKPPAVDRSAGYWCREPDCPCAFWIEPDQPENPIVDGMGPDAPTIIAANGAKQSHAPYAFTSIDPLALLRVALIQQQGDSKYGPDNWRRLPERDHINHALAHLFAHLAGDTSDDHLGHAAVRTLFALAVNLRPDFHGEDQRDRED